MSFTQMLQDAAGRAWARSSSSASTSGGSAESTYHDIQPEASSSQWPSKEEHRTRGRRRPFSLRRATHFQGPYVYPPSYEGPRRLSFWQAKPFVVSEVSPEDVTDADCLCDALGLAEDTEDAYESEYSDLYSTFITPSDVDPFAPRKIPRAKDRRQLLHNLIRLATRDPVLGKATLSQLVHYHSLHHSTARSPSSYNLLIQLALRATDRRLISALFNLMEADGISPTQRTTMLRIRWLIAHGNRADAWDVAKSSAFDLRSIPLPHVLEFFRDTRTSVNPKGSATARSAQEFLLVLEAVGVNIADKPRPRVIAMVVKSLLLLNRPDDALTLARSYLRGAGDRLDVDSKVALMQIVHIIMQWRPLNPSAWGLMRKRTHIDTFNMSLELLHSLLPLHPALRPTPTTLMVLLGHLRRSSQCGRLGQKVVREFKAQWGPNIEDRDVRRRLLRLSIKQNWLEPVQDRVLYDEDEYWEEGGEKPQPRDGKWAGQGARIEFESAFRPRIALRLTDRAFYPHRGRRNIWWAKAKVAYLRARESKWKKIARKQNLVLGNGFREDEQVGNTDEKLVAHVPHWREVYSSFKFHRTPPLHVFLDSVTPEDSEAMGSDREEDHIR